MSGGRSLGIHSFFSEYHIYEYIVLLKNIFDTGSIFFKKTFVLEDSCHSSVPRSTQPKGKK
jgi:hypothetical protein